MRAATKQTPYPEPACAPVASRIQGDYAASDGVTVRCLQSLAPAPKNVARMGCKDRLQHRNNTLIRFEFFLQPTVTVL